MREEYTLEVYKTARGRFPFNDWENKLSRKDRSIILARLIRVRQGNFGDCKPIKGKGTKGLFELRIHVGPGYRIYYGVVGKKVILILSGGDKGTQDSDIDKVKEFWKDYLDSSKGGE